MILQAGLPTRSWNDSTLPWSISRIYVSGSHITYTMRGAKRKNFSSNTSPKLDLVASYYTFSRTVLHGQLLHLRRYNIYTQP